MRTHSMVTRAEVGTFKQTQRLNLHTSHISFVPKSPFLALKDPFLAYGTLSHYKARLVANGSSQQIGIDCDETFSSVVKPATIRTVLSLALSRQWPRFLYSLKQAPRAWHGSDIAYLLIYVDDIVLTASSTSFLRRIISSLHREFEMTDLGALNYLLGISVTRNTAGMFLSQRKYTLELLLQAHMSTCNLTRTPVDTESKLGPVGDPVLDPTLYHSLAAALKCILRYVKGTLDFGLQLYTSSTSSLIAYSDTDWVGCPSTRRSTSGYCVFFGNNLLSWSSKRQPTLSRSSVEAEHRGVANAVAETAWLRNLLLELHISLFTATLVYCDNVSAIYLTANPVQHQRTKHIEIDIHFVRDKVAKGQVRMLHVTSRYQCADIFTKGLASILLEEFRCSLSVRSSPAKMRGS
ncbi:ribonuclease H-like domain-containing protein [Tanacetum coccineum]